MTGYITLGDVKRGLTANGLSPFLYRKIFKKDFFTERYNAQGETGAIVSVYTEMCFVMAMQHDLNREQLFKLTESDFYDFLESIAGADIENHINEIHALYEGNEVTTSDPKGADD